MMSRMPQRVFNQWYNYAKVEPFGAGIEDIRSARRDHLLYLLFALHTKIPPENIEGLEHFFLADFPNNKKETAVEKIKNVFMTLVHMTKNLGKKDAN